MQVSHPYSGGWLFLLGCIWSPPRVSGGTLDYYNTSPADIVPPGQQFTITFDVDVPDASTTVLVIRQWVNP